MNNRQHRDDYYPIRWKVADAIEDLFLLHRNTAIGVLALLGIGAIVLGLLIFDGDGSTVTETTSATAQPAQEDDAEAAETTTTSTTTETTTTAAPETTTTTTTSAPETTTTTTTAAPETTTTEAVSPRAPANDGVVAATQSGRLLRLTETTVQVIGGLPSEAAADDTLAIAAETFPNFTIDDSQVVDASFSDDMALTIRIDAPDLFDYNSDDLNSIYLPIIDELAASIIAEGWSVQVGGHTDASGPTAGNQVLSEGRATSAAARLRDQGVNADLVTTVGFGETQPIGDNATEAGRLANRRVEFILTP